MKMQPFTDSYVRDEIAFMEYSEPDEYGCIASVAGIDIVSLWPHSGDEYLNSHVGIDTWRTPVVTVDGITWMSLSSLEVQSSYMGWYLAEGVVGMGGLGTGYTALRAAEKPEVYSVEVFERDQRVIDLFYQQQQGRKALDKITVTKCDLREVTYHQFDFFFNDVYLTMLPVEAITDIPLLLDNNDIKTYRFWGQEKAQLAGITAGMIFQRNLTQEDSIYLDNWKSTEASGRSDNKIPNLQYIKALLHTMANYPQQTGLKQWQHYKN